MVGFRPNEGDLSDDSTHVLFFSGGFLFLVITLFGNSACGVSLGLGSRRLVIRSTERYLDLEGRYPPGITPFRLCYFVEPKCVAWALPDGLDKLWPIWRRYADVEIGAIRSAEFSVWKTIAPAAAVTGYLTDYACREQTR